MRESQEQRSSLWMLTAGPALWAVHFLLCYVTAAVWCAKAVGRVGPLDTAQLLIGGYTVLALAGIGVIGWRGFHQQGGRLSLEPRSEDSAEGRHRFLGFAILLLAGLSAVGVIYVALPALFIGSCQ